MKPVISATEYTNRNGVPIIETWDGKEVSQVTNYDKLEKSARFKKVLDRFIATGVMRLETIHLPNGSSLRVAVRTNKKAVGALTL